MCLQRVQALAQEVGPQTFDFSLVKQLGIYHPEDWTPLQTEHDSSKPVNSKAVFVLNEAENKGALVSSLKLAFTVWTRARKLGARIIHGDIDETPFEFGKNKADGRITSVKVKNAVRKTYTLFLTHLALCTGSYTGSFCSKFVNAVGDPLATMLAMYKWRVHAVEWFALKLSPSVLMSPDVDLYFKLLLEQSKSLVWACNHPDKREAKMACFDDEKISQKLTQQLIEHVHRLCPMLKGRQPDQIKTCSFGNFDTDFKKPGETIDSCPTIGQVGHRKNLFLGIVHTLWGITEALLLGEILACDILGQALAEDLQHLDLSGFRPDRLKG
jgi:glycine/D-amino acid oxidase-like deaminating enzyme